jgi:hypothetical protein
MEPFGLVDTSKKIFRLVDLLPTMALRFAGVPFSLRVFGGLCKFSLLSNGTCGSNRCWPHARSGSRDTFPSMASASSSVLGLYCPCTASFICIILNEMVNISQNLEHKALAKKLFGEGNLKSNIVCTSDANRRTNKDIRNKLAGLREHSVDPAAPESVTH